MKKNHFLLSLLMAFMAIGNALAKPTFSMSASNLTGKQGETVNLEISLANNEEIRDFQLDIFLPEGLTIAQNDKGKYLISTTERDDDHQATCNLSEGRYKVAVASMDGTPIAAGTGAILTVPVMLDAEPGTYEIGFSNCHLSQVDANENATDIAVDDFKSTITVEEPEAPLVVEDFQFYAKNITVEEGQTEATLEVRLNNSESIKNFSFDIVLPAGVSVNYSDELEYYNIVNVNRLLKDVEGEYENEGYVAGESNVFQVSYSSARGKSVAAGNDVVFKMVLDIAAGAGEYDIVFENQIIDNEDSPAFTAKLTVKGEASAEAEATMAIGAARWATFVAPFDVEVPAGVTASIVEAVDNGTLTLTAVKGTIPANTPVVLYSETEVNKTLSGKVVEAASAEAGLLVGTYTAMEAPVGAYVLQKHGEKVGFYLAGETRPTVGANRAYLNVPAGSEVKAYFFDDMETSIETVEVAAQGQAIYDLSGRRVQKAVKGMYIVDGKKVIK